MNGPPYPELHSQELASSGEVEYNGHKLQASAVGVNLYFPLVHAVHGPPMAPSTPPTAPAHPALHVHVLFVAVSTKLGGQVLQKGYAPDTVQVAAKPFLL